MGVEPVGVDKGEGVNSWTNPMDKSHGERGGVGFGEIFLEFIGMICAVIYHVEYTQILGIKRKKSQDQLASMIERAIEEVEAGECE